MLSIQSKCVFSDYEKWRHGELPSNATPAFHVDLEHSDLEEGAKANDTVIDDSSSLPHPDPSQAAARRLGPVGRPDQAPEAAAGLGPGALKGTGRLEPWL